MFRRSCRKQNASSAERESSDLKPTEAGRASAARDSVRCAASPSPRRCWRRRTGILSGSVRTARVPGVCSNTCCGHCWNMGKRRCTSRCRKRARLTPRPPSARCRRRCGCTPTRVCGSRRHPRASRRRLLSASRFDPAAQPHPGVGGRHTLARACPVLPPDEGRGGPTGRRRATGNGTD